jgi:hypothetical protein
MHANYGIGVIIYYYTRNIHDDYIIINILQGNGIFRRSKDMTIVHCNYIWAIEYNIMSYLPKTSSLWHSK